jgi:MinD superfamily P-loop ATPase
MNLDPALVPTLQVARERGLYQPDDIEILGEAIDQFVIEDFDVNRSKASTTGQQKFYMDLFRDWVTPKPVIDPQECTMCGRCVSVCPATPKAVRFLNGRQQAPQYDYKHCIRCYCCQETCPYEAINIKTPLLGQLLEGLKL